MKLIVSALLAASLLFSCTKNSISLAKPQADFYFGQYDTAAVIGTHDKLYAHNRSVGYDSLTWTDGNGKTYRGDLASLTYDVPGDYKVSLTAYNKSGTTTISRSVKVMERVLKSFSINNVYINRFALAQNGLPLFSKINMWLEVKFSHSNEDAYTSNGDILAPVVYQSPVFTNIDSSFHSSLNFTLNGPDKVVIKAPVNNSDFTSVGRGILINLYGQDNSGTYLLASSAWSGIGIHILNGGNPAHSSEFGLQTLVAGSPTSVVLNCQYQ